MKFLRSLFILTLFSLSSAHTNAVTAKIINAQQYPTGYCDIMIFGGMNVGNSKVKPRTEMWEINTKYTNSTDIYSDGPIECSIGANFYRFNGDNDPIVICQENFRIINDDVLVVDISNKTINILAS